jgi:hypothetical protein
MAWKAWGIVLAIGMLVLALCGLVVHSDPKLVVADLLGAAAVATVVALAGRGSAVTALPIVAGLALVVIALLVFASHGSPILMALTLAFAFAFVFVSLATGSRRPPGAAEQRPRPA